MTVDPGTLGLAVAALAVAVGALVQGLLGFGLALLAVPVLAWVAPAAVPEGLLVAVLPLVVAAALRERRDLDLPGVGWALLGRLPGGVLGGLLVAVLPVRGLQVVVALTVLAAVLASASGRRAGGGTAASATTGPRASTGPSTEPEPNTEPGAGTAGRRGPPGRVTLVVAGALSGLGGTTSGIGGPPMALAYRRRGGPALRSTLSLFFLVGAVLSLLTLAVVGELSRQGVLTGLALLPAVAVGYLGSSLLRRHLDTDRVSGGVLVLSAIAGLALLASALTG